MPTRRLQWWDKTLPTLKWFRQDCLGNRQQYQIRVRTWYFFPCCILVTNGKLVGILGVPLSNNPFHEGSQQSTPTQTTNVPLADWQPVWSGSMNQADKSVQSMMFHKKKPTEGTLQRRGSIFPTTTLGLAIFRGLGVWGLGKCSGGWYHLRNQCQVIHLE